MKKLKFKDINIDDKLKKAIEQRNYISCTPVQQACIPSLLKGNDHIIQAKTGSGKTAAFCIPLIEQLSFEDKNPTTIIVAPTRELAQQIHVEFNSLAIYKKVHAVLCVGKMPYKSQILQLKQRCQVIICTPGRIIDLINMDTIDLKYIDNFILDEACELVQNGLLEQVIELRSMISPKQTWLFSATLDNIDSFDFLELNNPINIRLNDPKEINQDIKSYYYNSQNIDQDLDKLLNYNKVTSCFIFANTQKETEEIFYNLNKKDYLVSYLHGALDQKKRNQTIDKFKKGKIRILVSTNVCARGIDVDDVSLVIHYRLPIDFDSYIHRSGRTSRNNKSGISIVLSNDDDKSNIKDQILENTQPFIFNKKFNNSLDKPLLKENKNRNLEEKNCSLFIRCGKKDKIRSSDIVGALCNNSVPYENIGIINIQNSFTTVTLLNTSSEVINALHFISIKGKRRKVEIKRKDQNF
ncbi:MAG: DEAD/DEAH box helicase [Anaerorhabdus sp.]